MQMRFHGFFDPIVPGSVARTTYASSFTVFWDGSRFQNLGVQVVKCWAESTLPGSDRVN